MVFVFLPTIPSLCLPSSTHCIRRQRHDRIAHPLCSNVPTIQYLYTNPRFPLFNLDLPLTYFASSGSLRSWLDHGQYFAEQCDKQLSCFPVRIHASSFLLRENMQAYYYPGIYFLNSGRRGETRSTIEAAQSRHQYFLKDGVP